MQAHENRSDMPEHTGTDPGDLPSKWQAPLKTSLTSIGMAVRTPAAAQKPDILRQKLTRNRILELRNMRSSRLVSSIRLFVHPLLTTFRGAYRISHLPIRKINNLSFPFVSETKITKTSARCIFTRTAPRTRNSRVGKLSWPNGEGYSILRSNAG